jgi:hypothetical protein
MAKDKRLYMTFPNDFWMHPKIAPLSTEAKWAFVEMNGYSRMQDLDGRIPAVMVERMWDIAVVAELVASHPDRPVVLCVGDDYIIRDYSEHQQTTSDREEMSKKRSESGKLGANKRWNGKPIASAIANGSQDDGKHIAETETETETTNTNSLSVAKAPDHGTLIPEGWTCNQSHRDKAASMNLDASREVERFTLHAKRTNRRLKSWNAGFTNWLKQGAVINQQRQTTPQPQTFGRSTVDHGREVDQILRRQMEKASQLSIGGTA